MLHELQKNKLVYDYVDSQQDKHRSQITLALSQAHTPFLK